MKSEHFVIGVDYGTDSVRSIIVDASNGTEIASSVYYYPRWKKDCIAFLPKTSSGNTRWIMLRDSKKQSRGVCCRQDLR